MDNQTLLDKFRLQFANVHALTVLTVSLFEIIGYIILIFADVEFFSLGNHYLWYNVVFPIVVNTVTHLVARFLIHNPALSRRKKNTSIIVASLITSLIVSVVHKEYIVTGCAFIFPIIMSAMFNSKRLLRTSFISSIFILLVVGFAFWLDKSATFDTVISLFVLLGFSFVSYLCALISIDFSRQNSMLIESQAAQNNNLMKAVLCDQMTGLYNHQSFVTELEKQVRGSNNSSLVLAILDIDDFKKINDSYGHDSGDEVLIYIADILKAYCTEGDSAYRYGGEEFAVLFSGKNPAEVFDIVDSILDEFRGHLFDFSCDSFTFSAGIAEYKGGITSDEFFEKTDKTLYKAKHEGKNRILISEQ